MDGLCPGLEASQDAELIFAGALLERPDGGAVPGELHGRELEAEGAVPVSDGIWGEEISHGVASSFLQHVLQSLCESLFLCADSTDENQRPG